MKIGSYLRRLREERGIKQSFIAEKASITNKYLSEVERDLRNPSFEMLEKISGALKVPLPLIFLGFLENQKNLDLNKRRDLNRITTALEEYFNV